MKRIFISLVAACCLLAAMTLETPPARMVTDFQVLVNRDNARVGETLIWSVEGITGVGPYQYMWSVFRDGHLFIEIPYWTDWPSANVLAIEAPEPGVYYGVCAVRRRQ